MAEGTEVATTETKGLVTYELPSGDKISLSPSIIRSRLVRGQGDVSDQEVMFFLATCKANRLNPFNNEAYLIKYGTDPAAQVISYHVFISRADRQEQYDGFESGLYLRDSDGKVVEREGAFYTPDEEIAGAWCRVYRKDRSRPFLRAVTFEEYQKKKKDGTPQKNWSKSGMPGTMIIKIPIGQSHRDAFPNIFSNLFMEEEITGGDSTVQPPPIDPDVIDAEVVEDPKPEPEKKESPKRRGRPPKTEQKEEGLPSVGPSTTQKDGPPPSGTAPTSDSAPSAEKQEESSDDEPPMSSYDKDPEAAKAPATTSTGKRDFGHLPKNLQSFVKVVQSKEKFGITLDQFESKWGKVDEWTHQVCKEIADIISKIKSTEDATNIIDNLQLKGAMKIHAGGTEKEHVQQTTSQIMTEGPDGRHYAVVDAGLCNPETGLLVYEKKPVLQKIGILREKINKLGGEGSDAFYMDGTPDDLSTLSFNEIADIHDSLAGALSALQEA